MADIFRAHRGGFWTKARKRSLYVGFFLLFIALVIQTTAGRYSARHAIVAPPASDLLLDNLPVVNMDFVIVTGAIAFWVIVCWLMAVRPRYLLFGLKAIAMFIIIRAFFITLTHLGVYPSGVLPGGDDFGYRFYRLTTYEGNLFFSGHTGFPFLMMLIFWDQRFWRWFCLAATFLFAASVLLAHVHYSIDVFAAPFITYSIFALARKLFTEDYALLAGQEV